MNKKFVYQVGNNKKVKKVFYSLKSCGQATSVVLNVRNFRLEFIVTFV